MLYVAIGRNVGDSPMGKVAWSSFRDDVVDAVGCGFPDTIAYGQSSWDGETEETCVLVWFYATLSVNVAENLDVVRAKYGQDAIAALDGNVELIGL